MLMPFTYEVSKTRQCHVW